VIRKTFERAGIQRDYGEKEKEKKKEKKEEEKQEEEHEDLDLGDEEEEHDDAASEDTVGTVEMLETKVQEMEEKIIELESLNNALEQENAELTQKVEDLEEALSAAEEKIELLEESEMRWREKNSVLRVENEELRMVIDRVSNRVGDLETDMVKKLLEIRGLKEKAARDERRRALMLQNMEGEIRKLEGSGMVKALFKVAGKNCERESETRDAGCRGKTEA
jgi:chromosome segregation ATPase